MRKRHGTRSKIFTPSKSMREQLKPEATRPSVRLIDSPIVSDRRRAVQIQQIVLPPPPPSSIRASMISCMTTSSMNREATNISLNLPYRLTPVLTALVYAIQMREPAGMPIICACIARAYAARWYRLHLDAYLTMPQRDVDAPAMHHNRG